jgi:hypothetical protein
MHELITFSDGGFSFLRGVFPYSQGVVAQPGFVIERARFARPVPVAEGFRRIADHLAALGRPPTTLCACELRSPKPFSFAGFGDFNRGYVAVLEQWGLFRKGLNPVARSNVAPEIEPPSEPCFHAFCYTVPLPEARPSFVVAGSGEWPEGGRHPEDIIARGDATAAGLQTKARWVLAMMAQRLRGLGVSAAEVTVAQVYTVRDFHPLMPEVLRATPNASVSWHYCRPPIEGLDYEMDLRAVSLERVLAA